ncbi:MAG: trypsin-like peptidase domain-containing protein, partial [Gelidibacter sp.]|nr:trypsin-like peptidase domain-containing protein [Gelidibacter sp.]
MKKILTLLLVSVLGGIITLSAYKLVFEKDCLFPVTSTTSKPAFFPTTNVSNTGVYNAATPDFTVAAENTVHAVVHVMNTTMMSAPMTLQDLFLGRSSQRPQVGTGSGVIISPDGYIITNNHVINGAQNISITLNDNKTYTAELIGSDEKTDIALLKIDADENLPYATFGDSDQVKVGEWVLAVGNPFNLTSTVTAGIVSAKARNINILGDVGAIESFIQTDAVVNPGNSGGALVDTKGELVGINAAIASNTGSYTGYSFAIPSNIVKKVISDFIDYGEIQRAYLGITFREIDGEFANEKGLDNTYGVYVVDVSEDGAAGQAGIISGDVIVQVDNSKINNKSSLLEAIGTKRPGDEVQVFVHRGNSMKQYTVTLKNRSGNTEVVKKDNIEILGGEFEPVSKEVMDEPKIEKKKKI